MQIWQLFLFIHVLTAIVAFGPSFAFPVISRLGAEQPEHRIFSLGIVEAIERRVVVPGALTMPVSGLLVVFTAGFDLLAMHWLLLGIALYVVAIVFAVFVQLPMIERMLELVRTGRPAFAEGPGAALAGPPPEIAALGARIQQGGMILTVLLVAIVALMVIKPAF